MYVKRVVNEIKYVFEYIFIWYCWWKCKNVWFFICIKNIFIEGFLSFSDVVGWYVYVIYVIIFYSCGWWIKIDFIFNLFKIVYKYIELFEILIIGIFLVIEF